MHRFYIETTHGDRFEVGRQIELPPDTSHQIRNVLRLKHRDHLTLFNGDGKEWNAELMRQTTQRTVSVKLIDVAEPDVEMHSRIVMVMALTRPQRYEIALAKCAELGAAAFKPIISERVLKSETQIPENRMKRWKRIVQEASELSGRVKIPAIAEPASFSQTLADLSNENANIIFLWEKAQKPSLAELLQHLKDEHQANQTIALILGPVGGFSENEANIASTNGAKTASLGPRTLRTETAAIASISLATQLLP